MTAVEAVTQAPAATPETQGTPTKGEPRKIAPQSRGFVQEARAFLSAITDRRQFALAIFLTMLIGSVVAVTKFTQGVMTGKDEDNDGKADDGAEFVVDSVRKSTEYLVYFGVFKAIANLSTTLLADKYGRRLPMIAGWIFGLGVPIMTMAATSFGVVSASSAFLGVQQGMCWTLAIVLMVDNVGKRHAGAAVGLNETTGYVTVALMNLVAAALVGEEGGERDYRTGPYIFILACLLLGLGLSAGFLKDTKPLVEAEEEQASGGAAKSQTVQITWPSGRTTDISTTQFTFAYASFVDRNLRLCCLVGLMINFNTAFVWGILTKWLKTYGADGWQAFSSEETAQILLAYALPKGLLQYPMGILSDRLGRRRFVAGGLAVVGIAELIIAIFGNAASSQDEARVVFVIGSLLLGCGTATMYTPVIAATADQADATWRASCLGAYRFWRDMGYAAGGLILGSIADDSTVASATAAGATATLCVAAAFGVFFRDRRDYAVDSA